jgi:hypothetical protein
MRPTQAGAHGSVPEPAEVRQTHVCSCTCQNRMIRSECQIKNNSNSISYRLVKLLPAFLEMLAFRSCLPLSRIKSATLRILFRPVASLSESLAEVAKKGRAKDDILQPAFHKSRGAKDKPKDRQKFVSPLPNAARANRAEE